MLNKAQGLPLRKLADDARALLQTMLWPGNVRQLKNVVERVLILGESEEISAKELPASDEASAAKKAVSCCRAGLRHCRCAKPVNCSNANIC